MDWKKLLTFRFGAKPPPLPQVAPEDELGHLFHSSLTARTPEALVDFAEFCSRFRRYSIFNARLIQTQRQCARACATAAEWRSVARYVLPDARPIVILQPFGPVAYVYDVEDTGPPHNRKMEAEAVAWLVARRAGVLSSSAAYLRRHVAEGKVGEIDTELVVRAAARIENLAGLRYMTTVPIPAHTRPRA